MAPHRSLLCLILVTALGLCRSEESPAQVKCRFGGTEYDVGRTWHPRLETQGAVFCVTCRCYEGGKLNCTSKQCPVNCSDGEEECCRICAESQQKPMTTDAVACVYDGHVYDNGEVFYPNSTVWSVFGPEQCVQCKCQEGLVLCEEQVCDKLICQEPIHMQNSCCPQCPEEAENKETSSKVTLKEDSRAQHDKDCISSGKYYLDGASWHPVIGPFGLMDCVMCRCNAGTIECSRYNCPSTSELPCSKPVTQFGQCCPACPIKVMSAVQDEEEDGTVLLQCIPNNSELVVYRAQGAGNLSEFLQYAFAQSASDVELHSWVLRMGSIHSFQIQTITDSDFVDLRHKFQFAAIGTSSLKRVGKFAKKAKKLKRRCKTKCSAKIKQLEEMLVVEKVVQRRKCHATETLLPAV